MTYFRNVLETKLSSKLSGVLIRDAYCRCFDISYSQILILSFIIAQKRVNLCFQSPFNFDYLLGIAVVGKQSAENVCYFGHDGMI